MPFARGVSREEMPYKKSPKIAIACQRMKKRYLMDADVVNDPNFHRKHGCSSRVGSLSERGKVHY
jgi:hypothetical protein